MTDRDVYLKLAAMADELKQLAEQAETVVGDAALRSAASTLAGMARAVYDHALGGDAH
jgi:hypothetical protein